MDNVLNILKYFGYSNPADAYQKLSMNQITSLIHEYYRLHST